MAPHIEEIESPVEPKILPPFAVVVYNDNDHTYEYVIITFQKVFGYALEKCVDLATIIDNKGKAVVWIGSKEVAELKMELIQSAGPDLFAGKKVEYPLNVDIVPMC